MLNQILHSRKNFLLRYTIPAPGFGWIAKSFKLKEFTSRREGLLFNNLYRYATDNELLFALIKSGWKYKFMKNNSISYFFVLGGRSNQNLIELSNEACEYYGKTMSKSKLKCVYSGLNKFMLLYIAHNFAGNNGVVHP